MRNKEANILFATDFSEPAREAFGYAQAVAKTLEGKLLIVNVLQVPMEMDIQYPVNTMYLEQLRSEATVELDRLVQSAKDGEIPTATRQLVGDPAHCISECASEEAATMIVMGTHGRSGVPRLLLGSVAEKVVREGPCPVFTVRPLGTADAPKVERRTDIDCLLVPMDFSDFAQEALEVAVPLAKKWGATIRLVHALEAVTYPLDFTLGHATDEKASQTAAHGKLDELARTVKADGVSCEIVCEVKSPAELILAQVKVASGYLIVMGTHGRRGLSRLALGSVAESIVRQALCPVLTVKSPKYRTAGVSKSGHATRDIQPRGESQVRRDA